MKLGLNGNWFNSPKKPESVIQDKPAPPKRKYSAYRTILAHQEEVSARLSAVEKQKSAQPQTCVECDTNPE